MTLKEYIETKPKGDFYVEVYGFFTKITPGMEILTESEKNKKLDETKEYQAIGSNGKLLVVDSSDKKE